MKYIDNLIAWGDQLFRRDTIEAINEATTLYVLAYELLGPATGEGAQREHADKSYNELTRWRALDPFGNKQVDVLMENFTGTPRPRHPHQAGTEPLPVLSLLFRHPNNDRLLDYWNTVEDRLFKIRHCMNIQGSFGSSAAVRAADRSGAAGEGRRRRWTLQCAGRDRGPSSSPYRFHSSAQKALELCGEVRALGDKLLGALEKYDAEGLSLLRRPTRSRC